MKSQLRFSCFAALAMLCLMLAALPASAATYSNGPPIGEIDAWTINFGYVVSDTFTGLTSPGSFSFWVWEQPGDKMLSVDWSISTSENGAPVPGGFGTANTGVNLVDSFVSYNGYGYQFDRIDVSNLGVSGLSASSTYWLNLQNAVMQSAGAVYWDENSGSGCSSPGCPSLASENSLGTIPSESFNISDAGSGGGSTPEPGSILLFGSGAIGIAGVLRRRLLG